MSWSGGRSRTRTSGEWSGTIGCRAPELAASQEIGDAIRATRARVVDFAGRVHAGSIRPPGRIGLPACWSLASAARPWVRSCCPTPWGGGVTGSPPPSSTTPTPTVSTRSGRSRGGPGGNPGGGHLQVGCTPETRNGMLEATAALGARGLAFAPQAVAITQEGSALDRQAVEQGFLERFPMWDWVGGRTSVLSAVGLLPAALQGLDIAGLLEGAAAMDRATRRVRVSANPAALLALALAPRRGRPWRPDMVVIPYKDRLALLARYLQQLVMESLGKEKDLDGGRPPGARGVRQQGLHRPARLRPATSGRARQLLRHLCPGADRAGRSPGGGGAGGDQRRLPGRLPAWHPPGSG